MSHTYDVTNFKLKREFQKRQKWKSQEFMVVFKFWRSENLSNNIADSVTLSGPERQERLIEFLGLFARRDAIRDDQFEFAPDSASELSNSDNESE